MELTISVLSSVSGTAGAAAPDQRGGQMSPISSSSRPRRSRGRSPVRRGRIREYADNYAEAVYTEADPAAACNPLSRTAQG